MSEMPTCPACGQRKFAVVAFVDENDRHQHTHYHCTFWPSKASAPCGWHGWTVPGWDQ